jgi:hypothetical protein
MLRLRGTFWAAEDTLSVKHKLKKGQMIPDNGPVLSGAQQF